MDHQSVEALLSSAGLLKNWLGHDDPTALPVRRSGMGAILLIRRSPINGGKVRFQPFAGLQQSRERRRIAAIGRFLGTSSCTRSAQRVTVSDDLAILRRAGALVSAAAL
jgi:hypothetical protein